MVATEKQKKNLIPLTKRSQSEARAIRSMGALSATAAKNRKKMVKELATTLMDMQLTQKESEALRNLFPKISEEECVNKAMLIGSLKRESVKGNVKAIELLLALIGELPAKELAGNIITQKVFVSQEQHDATLKHIASVISDGNDK